jgi:glycosyltransferase involved in cell wall biosynthesis
MTLTDFFLICPKYNLIPTKEKLCTGPNNGNNCQKLCPEFSRSLINNRLEVAYDVLKNASAITCPSNFAANLIQQEFPQLKIQVVNHGMQVNKLKINQKYYSDQETIIFGYASSLNKHKGTHILIDAFQKVKQNNIKLKIYGSGENKEYINNLKNISKKDDRIQFCGVYQQENLGTILSNLDIMVIPSLWYETYCMTLHEALACKVPVIASDIGVMSENIEDNVNGFLFEMGNTNQLEGILRKIANQPSILNQIKQNLKHRPMKTLSQESYTYYRLYNRVINQSKVK